jgi:hypothetical protein
MKAKLLNLFSVCLMSLVILSPALIFWKIWQCHIDYLNAQQVGFLAQDPIPEIVAFSSISLDSELVPLQTFQALRKLVLLILKTPAALGFIVSTLLGFYSGRLLNSYHQARRNLVFKRYVASLEKAWQQKIY